MIRSCLRRLRWLLPLGGEPAGQLEAIYIASEAGAPMGAIDTVRALTDLGLEGDRYARDTGHWRATDGCQVTLIHAEHLARGARRYAIELGDGRHRRNLVVAGLANERLIGATLQIGTARLHCVKQRPPCGYLDRIAGPGTAKALGRHAGICAAVVAPGVLSIGDPVTIVRDAPPGPRTAFRRISGNPSHPERSGWPEQGG
jgi:MOSC domain-containing protein YiiM